MQKFLEIQQLDFLTSQMLFETLYCLPQHHAVTTANEVASFLLFLFLTCYSSL